jgi:hypothetical protein
MFTDGTWWANNPNPVLRWPPTRQDESKHLSPDLKSSSWQSIISSCFGMRTPTWWPSIPKACLAAGIYIPQFISARLWLAISRSFFVNLLIIIVFRPMFLISSTIS